MKKVYMHLDFLTKAKLTHLKSFRIEEILKGIY